MQVQSPYYVFWIKELRNFIFIIYEHAEHIMEKF